MPVSRPPVQSTRAKRLKLTALWVCIALAIVGALLGLRSPMLHQYEYQEDLYLSLDGSASMYVSASLPALVALHGIDVPTDPRATLDRAIIRRAFTAPGVRVAAIRTWRRWSRRFVTVGVVTDDVRRLTSVAPFARDAFEYGPAGGRSNPAGYRLAEQLGPPAGRPVGDVGWTGGELVGFRWHIPSNIEHNNAPNENHLRGNILVWEQPLSKRLAGAPLSMEVVMEPRSILSGALWLFGVSALTALAVVALLLWWVVRKGRSKRVARTRTWQSM